MNETQLTTIPRHISFDFWHTLASANPNYRVARAEMVSQLYETAGIENLITDTFRTIGDRYNHEAEQDTAYFSPRELLAQVLEQCGLPVDTRLEQMQQQMDVLFLEHPPLLPFDQIGAYFEDWRNRGITLSITSNTAFTGGVTLRRMLDKAGLLQYFNFQLFSDEEKAAKPVRRLFETVFRVAQTQNPNVQTAADILHIGDNPLADIWGAQTAGFQALLLEGPQDLQKTLDHVSQVINVSNNE